MGKKLKATSLFQAFSKELSSIKRGKSDQIIVSEKKTVTDIIMLQKYNSGFLIQWEQLFLWYCRWTLSKRYISNYMLIISFDYVLYTSEGLIKIDFTAKI